jgi:ribonuclease HI
MCSKGVLYFAGVTGYSIPSYGAYGWVLYDNTENKLAEGSGYSSDYITKDKIEFQALLKGTFYDV